MPLKIFRQDITKIECDAIVNPTNRFLEPSGGAVLNNEWSAPIESDFKSRKK